MAFDLNTFRQALKSGGARQNLFEVTLGFPPTGQSPQQFTLLCKAASIPGQDITPIEIGYFGRKIKVAGDRTFPEWQITVINDEDFAIRNQFTSWSNLMNSHSANLRAETARDLDGYQMPATVTQYMKTGEIAKVYKFIGVFPSNVAPIDLGWETNDQIEEFQVTLQYQWWEDDFTS